MKEQDAAHFGSGVPSTLEFQEQHIGVLKAELTRLRSELQQKDEVIRELIVVAQGLRNYSWTDEYTNQKYDLIIKRAFESIEKSKAK